MKKLTRIFALLFAFALVASACGSSSSDADGDGGDPEGADLTQGGDLTFHMVTHADDGVFWSVVKKGAEAAAEDVGVTLVWLGSNNDHEKHAADIEKAITEGSDGIASSLPNADVVGPPLQKAAAEGIPVYTINSGLNDYQALGAVSHVGQDEIVAGQGAGERFNDLGVSNVMCVFQEESNSGLDERCAGLTETFGGTSNAEFGGLDADQPEQINTIKALLTANEDIDAILATGPVITLSALTAAQELGRDIQIGGFDLSEDLLGAIEAGDVAFTVDQQQYLQGYMPVILMYLQATNQNTAGGGQPILTGPGFVTKDNASAVLELSKAGTR